MTNIDELEKLADLKKRGVISASEFEEQKAALLCQSQYGPKSEAIYLVLAFFLGCFGLHNFYAGYIGRGIAQLLITLLLGLFVLPILVVVIWVFVDICSVRTDGQGKQFQPVPALRIVLIVLEALALFALLVACSAGSMAGYTMAMNRHRANQILGYAIEVAANYDVSNTALKCGDVIDEPDVLGDAECLAVNNRDTVSVLFRGLNPRLRKAIVDRVSESADGTVKAFEKENVVIIGFGK